ncbi:uncharacterized protein [Procambarus clarkii]|uniref:uncharacterized protein n=1 Tax=Procambarus clarkii TaxID=6728 RepID=UPI003742E017
MATAGTIGLTIGAGSAAAAAAVAVAAAGAVGIGVLGAAALRRRSRSRSGQRYGYGSRRTRRGRGRRFGRQVKRDSAEELEEALNSIRKSDLTGCGKRLVCELATRDKLSVEEMAILQLFGPTIKPGEGFLPPGATGEYKAAKTYGESGGDCGQAFPACPYNGSQLMNIVMEYLP